MSVAALEHRLSLVDAVEYLDRVKLEQPGTLQGVRRGQLPVVTVMLTDVIPLSHEGDRIWLDMQELAWPMDHAVMMDNYSINAMRTVSMKESRGRVIRPHPRIVEWSMTSTPNASHTRAVTAQIYLAVNEQWQCTDISNARYKNRGVRHWWGERGTATMNILAGCQAQDYYEWHVDLLTGSGTYMRFPVTPKAALWLLAKRDVEDGMTRRRALQHLVRAHDRAVGDRAVPVREHLRGRQPFSWAGLEGYVSPSQYDVDRLNR